MLPRPQIRRVNGVSDLKPRRFGFRLLQAVQRLHITPVVARRVLLRAMGVTLGHRARVKGNVEFFSRRVSIGDRAFVNTGCFFDAKARITIGSHVHLAPRVTLLTSTHEMGGPERRAGPISSAPITIGNGAWVGGGVIVLPGAVIGEGCVIAGGAVVTGVCEPNCLYAGVPAKKVREL